MPPPTLTDGWVHETEDLLWLMGFSSSSFTVTGTIISFTGGSVVVQWLKNPTAAARVTTKG